MSENSVVLYSLPKVAVTAHEWVFKSVNRHQEFIINKSEREYLTAMVLPNLLRNGAIANNHLRC